MRLRGLLLLAGLGIALAIGGLFLSWYGPGPADKPLLVTVSQGSTLTSAAADLEKAGAIRSAKLFLRTASVLGGKQPIKAGEYEVPAGLSAAAVLELLQSGKVIQHFLTIPEGMPSILVHDRLMAEPLLTGSVAIPEEGSILPDSYSFERGEARAAVAKRMQEAMTRTLDEAWKTRTPASAVKTRQEAVILASIVEKETGIPAERPQVAAVYTNRLRQGMKLQADPTTIYPITKGKPLGRRIRRSELDAVNAYNTYAIAGLPAGPIANPGRDSILAVLAPPQSKAIFFVADGKGGHIFAETLSQHQANVERYYAIRRQRGEM
jgi:UPF0755 protein